MRKFISTREQDDFSLLVDEQFNVFCSDKECNTEATPLRMDFKEIEEAIDVGLMVEILY